MGSRSYKQGVVTVLGLIYESIVVMYKCVN